MDFSSIGVVCSDIDLFHVTPTGFLVIGEIKNLKGEFKSGQRKLLSSRITASLTYIPMLYITATVTRITNCRISSLRER